jgi:hypothetical protein
MLSALLTFLIVMAIYIFIDWLRHRKNLNADIVPHRKIARHIWIYCAIIVAVAITMVNFSNIDPKSYRPLYGQYHGWYFPYGHYSNLRIGDIHDKTTTSDSWRYDYHAIMMNSNWDEIEEPDSISPYYSVLQSLLTYDGKPNSKTYGFGIALFVYDLTENIIGTNGNEEKAYEKLIEPQVNDSSLMQRTKLFTPYKAIASPTYATIHMGENGAEPALFKKHITIFANERAYAFTFFVDREFERPDSLNSFDYLDDIFINTAKKLDLHSYNEWKVDEATYNHHLHIKCWIYIGLYLICILCALFFAICYFKNTGSVNPKAAKWCKVLSIVDMATFVILGISIAIAFCTIHSEHISEIYNYRFADFIDDEHAATSILCYGAYFLLLIIPTNRIYLKSYTTPKIKNGNPNTKKGLIFWIVRPFALMTKWGQRFSKSFKEEYHNQISDLNKNNKQ